MAWNKVYTPLSFYKSFPFAEQKKKYGLEIPLLDPPCQKHYSCQNHVHRISIDMVLECIYIDKTRIGNTKSKSILYFLMSMNSKNISVPIR